MAIFSHKHLEIMRVYATFEAIYIIFQQCCENQCLCCIIIHDDFLKGSALCSFVDICCSHLAFIILNCGCTDLEACCFSSSASTGISLVKCFIESIMISC